MENPEQFRFWGLGGLGGISTVNLMNRLTQKLRRIILLHLALITFEIRFGRTRRPFMFHIFGFGGVSITPNTNISYLQRHQISPTNSRKLPDPFWEILFWDIPTFRKLMFVFRGWQIPNIRVTIVWKTWLHNRYLSKKWNGNLMIWDQDLEKALNELFGSSKHWDFDTKKPRHFETFKPWNFLIFNYGNPHHPQMEEWWEVGGSAPENDGGPPAANGGELSCMNW